MKPRSKIIRCKVKQAMACLVSKAYVTASLWNVQFFFLLFMFLVCTEQRTHCGQYCDWSFAGKFKDCLVQCVCISTWLDSVRLCFACLFYCCSMVFMHICIQLHHVFIDMLRALSCRAEWIDCMRGMCYMMCVCVPKNKILCLHTAHCSVNKLEIAFNCWFVGWFITHILYWIKLLLLLWYYMKFIDE